MSPARDDRTRLADVTLAELRRAIITAALLLTVLYLFLGMVASVLLAGVLGLVVGIYLLPVSGWIEDRVGNPAIAAVLALALLLLPVVVAVGYGYVELQDAAEYLEDNPAEVVEEIHQALTRVPLASATPRETIRRAVDSMAEVSTGAPEAGREALGGFLVALGIFLFTAFYVMTQSEPIVEYLRGSVPPRYARLTEALERHARGVLFGTVFAVTLTQLLKATTLFVLFLIFGVPIPITLAVLAFFIGFFPVVGSWTFYIPAAGYLLIFENAPMEALALVVAAFVISTVFLSFYVRPKLASEQSGGILNFYWMFLGLVAGVYAFGLAGVVVGPLLIGLLKAVVDTIRSSEEWHSPMDPEEPDAEILAEEELQAQSGS